MFSSCQDTVWILPYRPFGWKIRYSCGHILLWSVDALEVCLRKSVSWKMITVTTKLTRTGPCIRWTHFCPCFCWPHSFGVSSPWNVCVLMLNCFKNANISTSEYWTQPKRIKGKSFNGQVSVWLLAAGGNVQQGKVQCRRAACQRKLKVNGNLCPGCSAAHCRATYCDHEAGRATR